MSIISEFRSVTAFIPAWSSLRNYQDRRSHMEKEKNIFPLKLLFVICTRNTPCPGFILVSCLLIPCYMGILLL